jgi:hypothetical protein
MHGKAARGALNGIATMVRELNTPMIAAASMASTWIGF